MRKNQGSRNQARAQDYRAAQNAQASNLPRTNPPKNDDNHHNPGKTSRFPRSQGFASYNTANVKATGEFWVCLTIHAKRAFKDPESFKNFKGSEPYHNQILRAGANWNSANSNFEIDQDAVKLREHGFYAGVFEQYPLLYEFVPIYKYNDTDKDKADDILDLMPLPPSTKLNLSDPAFKTAHETLKGYFTEHQNAVFGGQTYHQNHHLFHLKYLTSKKTQEHLTAKLNAAGNQDILKHFKERDAYFHSRLALEFIAEWRKWKQKRLIMTRYGYFQIWLMQDFSDLSVDDVLRLGMGLNKLYFQRNDLKEWLADGPEAQYGRLFRPIFHEAGIDPFPMTCHYTWEIARIMISKYIASFNRNFGRFGPLDLVDDFQERWYKDDQSERIDSSKPDLPFRWQHRVFSLTEVRGRNGRPLPSSENDKILSTLLEGVPIRLTNGEGSQDFGAPEVSNDCVEAWTSQNLASWKNEVMLVSSDISVIYSPLATQTTCIFHQDISYSDYWKTVLRGLAFLCEMRMLAFQLKTETARLLEETLKTRHVTPGLVLGNRKLSMLLARLRTASDATTLAVGEYASRKFEKISEVFSIDKTIESTQKNLELSNAGLAQKESMSLERSQRVLNWGAALFAILALALELPSYWASSRDILLGDHNQVGYYLYRPFIDTQSHSQNFMDFGGILSLATTSLIILAIFSLAISTAISARRKLKDSIYFRKAERLYHK